MGEGGKCQKIVSREIEGMCAFCLTDDEQARERQREAGGGGWSRWAGREEASVTDREKEREGEGGKEQRAAAWQSC